MTGCFDFCPDRLVPKTNPPAPPGKGMSMNGWFFSARPNVPYQKSFTVKLQGMYWILKANNRFDYSTNPRFNARRLELFYEEHGTWNSFDFPHPHLGMIKCRFKDAVTVPEAIPNSGGLIDAFEVQLIHHDPGY